MERFKFRNLVDPFRPSRKCGSEVAAIMALSSMSAMASAASASQANSTQQAALDQSKEENALNRQFQARQATIARAYNTSERVAQQNYQTGQIENLMQYNKQLQSPVYQSQQLQAAGINPAVYFSNHSTFNGGATPGSNAPSGSGVSGVPTGASGLPGINPVVPDWASSMMVGANIAKTMSEAGMNKSQTDLILQKVFTEQLVQDTMKIDNMIKQAKYPAEVKKLWTEIKSEVVKQGLMDWQGKKYKSDIDLNESIQKLNKALENKNDQETLLLKRNLWELIDNYGLRKEVIASEGAKNRGEAAAGFGSARLSNAMADTEDALRNLKKEAIRLDNESKDNQNRFDTATFQDRVKSIADNLTFGQLKMFEQKVKNHDLQSYNALQRVLHGNPQGDDYKRVFDLFLHSDDLSGIPAPPGK